MAEQVEINNECDVESTNCSNQLDSDDDNNSIIEDQMNKSFKIDKSTLQIDNLPKYNYKNMIKKAGRTLLVKSVVDFDENQFKTLEGVQSVLKNKLGDSIFLVFDDYKNAIKGLKEIRQNYGKYHNLRVKFSYYKLFFKLNGMSNNDDYNTIKKGLIDFIGDNASVLYCKLYSKDKSYLGCGDLTVDTLEGLNNLLSSEKGLKEFKFDKYDGVFYKFNNKK